MTELKPCPFCGGNNIEMRVFGLPLPDFEDEGAVTGVRCNDCDYVISFHRRKQKTIELWNKRNGEEGSE